MLNIGPAAAAPWLNAPRCHSPPDDLPNDSGVAALRTGTDTMLLAWAFDGELLDTSLVRMRLREAVAVERGRARIHILT